MASAAAFAYAAKVRPITSRLPAPASVVVVNVGSTVSIQNALVRVDCDLSKGVYSAIDRKGGAVAISGARTEIDGLSSDTPGLRRTWYTRDVKDALGRGKTLGIVCSTVGKPSLILEITLYSGKGFLALAAGVENKTGADIRVKEIRPLVGGNVFPAMSAKRNIKTLNAYGGSGETSVASGPSRESANNMLLTFTGAGKRRSLVLGGLTYHEFIKFARVGPAAAASRAAAGSPPGGGGDGKITADLWASDPVGKLVDAGRRYVPDDRFYADFTTSDPFEALERYGLRLRAAQHARPNPYDFPTVCAWYVGLFMNSAAGNRPELSRYRIATTPGLVEEMDWIGKTGFLKYSRAAVRIVPDKYAREGDPLTEQGWWDDEHWARFGHYAPPYETSRKYGEAIRARGGLPFTYFQLVFESPDFRAAHREMMLGNDSGRGLDYTDPATEKHMREVYRNLREAGITGMMFDYPDPVWSRNLVNGGFEDKHATAASTYRRIFALAKEGLGPDSWIHERVLDDPLSDITAGVVDSQRVWGDTSAIGTEMVSKGGLRWYKNRVVYAYDMDSKNLLDGWKYPDPDLQEPEVRGFAGTDRDGRRMLLTMAYVSASRLLLATSFRDMPPEVLYDLERTFPYHTAPQSARPVDAFVTSGWPKVYDFAVDPAWHQLTLYNNAEPARQMEFSVPLSGDTALGALGLDKGRDYYVYDFWNDSFVGRLKGTARLRQSLRPGEARMLSIHRVEDHPQFLSTNRHVMQGYVDMPVRPAWDPAKRRLSGTSKVIGGETYKVVIAVNGMRSVGCKVSKGKGRVEMLPGKPGLAVLSIESPKNAGIEWAAAFKR